MGRLDPLPPTFEATRSALHRVAVHVLARRRHELVGRLGLRATPGGFGTPAAGPDHAHEVLRTSGPWLLRERTGDAATSVALDLRVATLAEAAALAGVDLDRALPPGSGEVEMGERDAPLGVDGAAAEALAAWYLLAVSVLDRVLAEAPPGASPSVLQLWPEHFDVGADLDGGTGRVNLGASPGDGFHADPYLYVGPWGPERPGDPAFWNAPFGAVLGRPELEEVEDPPARVLDFFRSGLAHLAPDRTG